MVKLESQIGELKEFLTTSLNELKELINSNRIEVLEKVDIFTSRLTDVEKHLETFDHRVSLVEATANQNSNLITALSERVEKLEKENADLKKVNVQQKISELEEHIEERTNRQLRETIVIKNVPEVKNDESYGDTKNLVAKVISDNMDISFNDAYAQIKRAHRERPRKAKDGTEIRKDKRTIYAAMHSWDLCEDMKLSFRKKCVEDSSFQIMVDQKYGMLTTRRRSKALETRKMLKDSGIITGAYVAFPARLMVNYPGDVKNNKKLYKLYEDFSKSPVELRRGDK